MAGQHHGGGLRIKEKGQGADHPYLLQNRPGRFDFAGPARNQFQSIDDSFLDRLRRFVPRPFRTALLGGNIFKVRWPALRASAGRFIPLSAIVSRWLRGGTSAISKPRVSASSAASCARVYFFRQAVVGTFVHDHHVLGQEGLNVISNATRNPTALAVLHPSRAT